MELFMKRKNSMKKTHLVFLTKMDSATLLQLKGSIFPSPPPLQPYLQSNSFNLENKVSPSVLLIIIILAIVFFVSGLLHLLVRFLWSPPSHRDPESLDNVTAFQGQLQQLFHLHDSGVDQSFIDTLPVFHYKAIIIGSKFKTPFDCAVCLCEFESEDKLRLLPKCSHAFHTQCIDTWLLSHSTCPLCRSSLLPDQFSQHTNFSPIVLLLESGPGNDESSRDHVLPERSNLSQMGHEIESGLGEIVTVKLGKYKNIDGGRGETEGGSGEVNKNVDSRRCFSMGSFEYVMDENSSLKVTISNTPVKSKKLPLIPGYKPAMSECDCESRREFKISGFEPFFAEEKLDQNVYNNGSKIEKTGRKKESFSVSKIWLRENKKKSEGSINSSRRAVSFRFPVQFNENEEDFYEGNHQSLAKKSLLWLMGRQKKVNFHFQSSSSGSSSLPSNI